MPSTSFINLCAQVSFIFIMTLCSKPNLSKEFKGGEIRKYKGEKRHLKDIKLYPKTCCCPALKQLQNYPLFFVQNQLLQTLENMLHEPPKTCQKASCYCYPCYVSVQIYTKLAKTKLHLKVTRSADHFVQKL
ncbi:unnamed protein product [Vicia faba]|uniref:Uncharacterized protein n=1 Tax=Vicia faba TaxID=3906 RepID=A0AAV0ZCT6_VICFA|nr:unnamed protein product [Vicia faba]